MIQLTDKDYDELYKFLGLMPEEIELMTENELEDAFLSISEIKLSFKESDDEQ